MIPRIKGLRISNAREREHITGSEFIPFQDEEINGKIKLSTLKDISIYVFNPEVTQDWLDDKRITQEEYDALYNAIENNKVIIVSPRVPVVGDWNIAYGQVMLNSKPCLRIPKFIRQDGAENLVRIEYYEVTFYSDRRLKITKYNTPDFLQTGNGKSVLTDNGQYVNIGNLALTNVVFEDGMNSCIYDLNSDKIVFGPKDTQCVTFNASKSDNTINMRLQLAKATATMDGIMSKEDKVKLDTTLTEQITALQNAIAQEIQDRTNADNVLQGKINTEKQERVTADNALTVKIDKEVTDRQQADELIHSRIQAETNTLHGRCNQLNSRIDEEHTAWTQADAGLSSRINAVEIDLTQFKNSKGQPNGLASLGSDGKVPASQLPSYVDDVLEFNSLSVFPSTGEYGKIYVAKDTNLTYRWGGTSYVEISKSLALGETSSTAYAGDKGKANRDAIVSLPSKILTDALVTNTTNSVVNIVQKQVTKSGLNYGTPTELTTIIPAATSTKAGVMTAEDKQKLFSVSSTIIPSLPQYIVSGLSLSQLEDTTSLSISRVVKNPSDGTYNMHADLGYVIETANQLRAGLMSKLDKKKLDDELPNQIQQEVIDRTRDVHAVRSTVNTLPTSIVSGELALLAGHTDKVPLVGRTYNKQSGDVYIKNNEFDTFGYAPMAGTGQAGMITGDFKVALDNALVDLAEIQSQIGGLGYTHPVGTAANKPQGLYKFATDATSHVSSVLAVVQKDITDLGIPSNANLTDALNNLKNEILLTVNDQIVNLGTNLSSRIDSLVNQLGVVINRVATLETQFSSLLDNLTEHVDNKNNPHQITKAQIGLGNVNNTSDMQKPVSTLQAATISNARAEAINIASSDASDKANFAKMEAIAAAEIALNNHANRKDNPHVVTRAQLSLDTTNEVVFKKVTAINGFHKE